MTCPIDDEPLPCTETRKGTELMALRSPGRPKNLEKHEAILDAAMLLFAERGMEGVPVEAVAAAAGVSKVTIYANFKDKAAILEAVVARETCRLGRAVAEISEDGGALGDRLKRVGGTLVSMLTEPCHMALDRCLGLEAQRNPDLARRFFESGPGTMRDILAEILREADAAGEIRVACPCTGAEDLLGLWLGFAAIEKRFLRKVTPPDVLAARIDRGVDLYLRANAV